jgi:hypothetical protein
MVLLADSRDPVLPDGDDRGDDSDLLPRGFEAVALLDMRLQIALVASRLNLLA